MQKSVSPFFDVQRKPLFTTWDSDQYDIFTNMKYVKSVPVMRDALINGETGEIVGVVAPRYKFVHNKDLATKIDQMMDKINFIGIDDHIDAVGRRWVREYLLDGDEYTFDITGKGEDVLKTKIRFFNSYDGKSSAGWSITAWRKICSNGMMGWRKLFSQYFAHLTEDIIERFHKLFLERHLLFGTEMNKFSALAYVPFTAEQFNTFVLNQDIPDRTAKNLLDYYPNYMDTYVENETKWGAYNVITGFATHMTKARSGSNIFSAGYRQMDKIARNFLDYYPTEVQYNEQIETAKERFEKIYNSPAN